MLRLSMLSWLVRSPKSSITYQDQIRQLKDKIHFIELENERLREENKRLWEERKHRDEVIAKLRTQLRHAQEKIAVLPQIVNPLLKLPNMPRIIAFITLITCFLIPTVQAAADPMALWDLAAIKDTSTLNFIFTPPTEYQRDWWTPKLQRSDLFFDSSPYPGLTERIHGVLFLPDLSRFLQPVVILCHGNGGYANENEAAKMCEQLDIPIYTIDGPGSGLQDGGFASTGEIGTADAWMSVIPEARDGFIYRYTHAVLRAITALDSLPQIDGSKTGVSGFSAGAWASLMSHGIDDRIQVSVPIAACADVEGIVYPPGSYAALLVFTAAGHTPFDPEWQVFRESFDALDYPFRPGLCMIYPTQDEFFPINAGMNTEPRAQRICYLPNYDHGIYFNGGSSYCGLYDSFDNAAEADRRINANRIDALRTRLLTHEAWPDKPHLIVEQANNRVRLVIPATLPPGKRIEKLRFWTSLDSAWLFDAQEYNGGSPGMTWTIQVSPLFFTGGIGFGEMELNGDLVVGSNIFIAPGVIPRIRPNPSLTETPTPFPTRGTPTATQVATNTFPPNTPTPLPSWTPTPTETAMNTFTATVTPQPTETMTETPLPTPSPTLTPMHVPLIGVAGYMDSEMTRYGGFMTIFAIARDLPSVPPAYLEVHLNGVPTEIDAPLVDAANGIYQWGPVNVDGQLSPQLACLELIFPTGPTAGRVAWPYLVVE